MTGRSSSGPAPLLSVLILMCTGGGGDFNLFDKYDQLILGLPRAAIVPWAVENAQWCVPLGTPTPRHEGGTITIRWQEVDLECLPKQGDRTPSDR